MTDRQLLQDAARAADWVYLSYSERGLVAEDGEVIATISRSLSNVWTYKMKSYIDVDSARRAAERDNGVRAAAAIGRGE